MAIRVNRGCSVLADMADKTQRQFLAGEVIHHLDKKKEEELIGTGFASPVKADAASDPSMVNERVPVQPGVQIPAPLAAPTDRNDALSIDPVNGISTTKTASPADRTIQVGKPEQEAPISKLTYDPAKLAKMSDEQVVSLLAQVDVDAAKQITDPAMIRQYLSTDFKPVPKTK